MRRPLCFICLAFVAAVFIALKLFPLSSETPVTEDSWGTYMGVVYQKEYKNGQLVLYLKQVNQVEDISKLSSNEKSDIRIMCYLQSGDEPRIGSTVCVEGKAQSFSIADNPGEFDQRSYYQVQKLSYRLVNGNLLLESEDYSVYREGLYRLRRWLEAIYDHLLPEKYASIMKAIVLGNKVELDAESKELYQRSGISHILAISGLHISLIGMSLYKLLRRVGIPLIPGAIVAVAIMIAYGDMVGMSSSAYRAIFMFAMKLIADVIRRTYDMLTALAVAGITLVIEQPLYLENAGFLLSFGAILGIGCVLEAIKIDTKVRKDKTKNKYIQELQALPSRIVSSLSGSISIFLVHFPMMLYFYYEFPIYSFLLNLVIIPLMGILMGMGLLCLLVGGIMTGSGGVLLAKLLATGCQIFLCAMEWLCETTTQLPFATWIVGRPQNWQMILFYGIVVLLLLIHHYCKRTEGKLIFAGFTKLLWCMAAVIMISQNWTSGLQLVMLDVGQGDSIWLKTKEGHHYLIDGGSTSESQLGKYTLIPFLKYMGTDKLDAVFLTHMDEDHTSGVYELIESGSGIDIERIVIASAVIRDDAYEELVSLCNTYKIPIVHVAAGDWLMDGDMNIEILHPSADYDSPSRNAYSLVMSLEYQGFRALLTGDVEEDGEAIVADALKAEENYHLYKVAHHGSRNSNTLELLEEISPQLSIISCAADNSYGHPHTETLERLEAVGSKIMVTKDYGAIMIEVDEKVEVRSLIQPSSVR